MQGVILAAGLGTRLRPVTDKRSKAMVPVLGKPLVERAMAPLIECGVDDFILVVGPDDDSIRAHFSETGNRGLRVRFAVQDSRLGMAHALALAAPLIEGPFLLSACDSIVERSHVEGLLAAAEGTDGVLGLLDVEPELLSRSAVVELQGRRVTRIVEKPDPGRAPSRTVSLPHYVFSPRILPLVAQVEPSPRGEYELQNAIQALIEEGGLIVGVHAERRLQVSTPNDLLVLTLKLLDDRTESGAAAANRVGPETALCEPVSIDVGAVVGRGCEIGPGVFLESGCRVGDGAVVRRSIVLSGGRVAPGELVEDRVVVG